MSKEKNQNPKSTKLSSVKSKLSQLIPKEKGKTSTSARYVIRQLEKKGKILFHYPSQFKDAPCSLALGQPQEVISIIGTSLGPEDLARAMGVSKAWYKSFGKDSLWLPHLPPHLLYSTSLRGCPVKVQLAYQAIARNCFVKGEIICEDAKIPNPHGVRYFAGAQMSPDGRNFLSYSRYGEVTFWRGVGSATEMANRALPQNPHHGKHVKGAVFSSDGDTAFTFDDGISLVRWKGFSSPNFEQHISSQRIGTFHGTYHSAPNGIELSGDGKWGLTFGWGGRVVLWTGLDTDSPQGVYIAKQEMTLHQSHNVMGGSISPDGSWALTVSTNAVVYWKGFQTGDITGTALIDNPHGTERIADCAISRDGTWALTVGGDKVVKWIELDSDSPTGTIIAGEEIPECNPYNSEIQWVQKVSFSPDGKWALTWNLHTFLIWYDLETEEPFFTILKMLTIEYLSVVFISPDNSCVISFGKNIHIYQPKVSLEVN